MHPQAQKLADRFLAVADRHAPGCIGALYIAGSAALDDFIPGKSDLDFVAVCDRPLTDDEGAVIAQAVGRTLDGIFLEPGDLARGPNLMSGPRAVMTDRGFARTEMSSARNPVAWETLAQCGIAARGPDIAAVEIWRDGDALRGWVRENARTYWRGRWRRSGVLFSVSGAASLTPFFTTWSVLGLARQHYTMRRGAIVSKSQAGQYALDSFGPRWRPIVETALAIRAGAPTSGASFKRRRETLDFMAMAIAEITEPAS